MTLDEAKKFLKKIQPLSVTDQTFWVEEINDALRIFLTSDPSEDEFVDHVDKTLITARGIYLISKYVPCCDSKIFEINEFDGAFPEEEEDKEIQKQKKHIMPLVRGVPSVTSRKDWELGIEDKIEELIDVVNADGSILERLEGRLRWAKGDQDKEDVKHANPDISEYADILSANLEMLLKLNKLIDVVNGMI